MTPRAVDANQSEIVAGLRGIGATVCDIHEVGAGCPDILVGFRGTNWLLEIKAPGRARGLTRMEVAWLEAWRGQAAVVTTIDDALRIIGATVGE
jgi:hypothetical protein